METIHRCTEKECPFVGQVTSKSCGCHKTAEQMMTERIARLERSLLPFVEAYEKAADPIGDSDLYDEQPRHVTVTLGDCRRAANLLGIYPVVRF